MQCALKAADIGHLALPWDQHKVWAALLQEEFFRQGDIEHKAGMPVSALMDRDNGSSWGNSQVREHDTSSMSSCRVFNRMPDG